MRDWYTFLACPVTVLWTLPLEVVLADSDGQREETDNFIEFILAKYLVPLYSNWDACFVVATGFRPSLCR